MNLTLIVEDNCDVCARTERFLQNLSNNENRISLSVVNRKEFNNSTVSIVPALFINNELYSYGDLGEKKLISFLRNHYQMEIGTSSIK